MISTNYSVSATSALRSLQATSRAMETSQTRISTGLKVSQASDDPTAWATATQIRGTLKTNEVYSTVMSDASAQAKLTTNVLGQLDESLRNIRTKVDQWATATAAADTTKAAALVNEISDLQDNITDAAKAASYKGSNWLEKTAGQDITVYTGNSSSTVIDIGAQIYGAGSLLQAASYNTTASLLTFNGTDLAADIADIKIGLDAAITAVGTEQTTYGSAQASLQNRDDFLSSMNDILSGQLSSLVDADLEEEAAKLSALQVRQQLATTALSIINQSQTNILRLFQ